MCLSQRASYESQKRRGKGIQRTTTIVYRQISNRTLWFYPIFGKSIEGMPKVVERSRKTKKKKTWESNQKYRQGVVEIEELDTAGFKECQPYAETIKLRKMRRNLSVQRHKKEGYWRTLLTTGQQAMLTLWRLFRGIDIRCTWPFRVEEDLQS